MIWLLLLVMLALACLLTRRTVELMGSDDCSDDPSECTHPREPLELRRVVNFLNHKECAAVREAAVRAGLARSTVVGEEGQSGLRTSSTVFLKENDNPIVSRIYQKVSQLLGVPADTFEDLQVIRYRVGEKYDAHFDPCYRCDQGSDIVREWTVLMYLNDDFTGGSTDFPLAGVSVAPQKGMAVAFRSMRGGKIVRQSKHQSSPVQSGTKWAATVWVRGPTPQNK